MSTKQQPSEYMLDMNAEVASQRNQSGGNTSDDIARQINAGQSTEGIDDSANPLVAEKIRRDLTYQHQIETIPQPDAAPLYVPQTTPELDRLEALQQELDAAKAEASRWKKEFGRREGTVGQMKTELQQLKAQVAQIQPAISVKQMTGKEPGEYATVDDLASLLMSQSSAFGSALTRLREELLAQAATHQDGGLPFEMEAELVEAHPWLTDLPRSQKLRAMHDILASSGVTVAPPQPNSPVATPPTLPTQARAPVRQVSYIEPSNKGSAAERNAAVPERQAFNEKQAKLDNLLKGPYKPGQSEQAYELLAALGAGAIDETQGGIYQRRR